MTYALVKILLISLNNIHIFSASEVTTLQPYTNLFIIIIIIKTMSVFGVLFSYESTSIQCFKWFPTNVNLTLLLLQSGS